MNSLSINRSLLTRALLWVVTCCAPWVQSSAANRLIDEKSPYLKQHAHNPVDWYPWGEEAFAKARAENKPIFLSVGYSTCHWCHVMEEESFENEEIAAQLNAHFINVKVDREERPDVDRVYMTFVQASTGSGGWPMSVWLTPELKPFFGGTYFAPEDRGRRPGFSTVIQHLADLWESQPEQIRDQSQQMLDALAEDLQTAATNEALPLPALRAAAFDRLVESFDPDFGGFDPGPKFPEPSKLELLVDLAATTTDAADRDRAIQLLTTTLHAIVNRGLHDHLAGGFHRYTVDSQWRVPHFEKMLYDQAQITHVLLSAWQLTAEPRFRHAAESTLAYVQRVMTHPDGAFYSAEDADSTRNANSDTKVEGAFYTWTAAGIAAALPAEERNLFSFAYGIEDTGNVIPAHDPEGVLSGQNVLYRAHHDADCAREFDLPIETVVARLAAGRERLRAERNRRPRPHLDDKVVTAWNGLMISAFARAGQILDNPAHTATARAAATFLRAHLFDEENGHLARSWRDGRRDSRGFAEDYAFLIQGLLDLYESDFDHTWLRWALQLQQTQIDLFWDDAEGGFFANDAADSSIVLRIKADHDGAEPAATSISVRNLGRLAALFHRDDLLDRAEAGARSLAVALQRNPLSLPQLLIAAGWLDGTAQQALIHGTADAPSTAGLLREIRSRFHSRRVALRIDDASRTFFESQVPFVKGLPDGTPEIATAYICENFVCQMPTTDPAELAELLER